jgi:hypothetical protein
MQIVKRVFLIGNGFNYLTADIINRHDGSGIAERTYQRKEVCVNNILFLTRLWERFDEAFDELKKETKGLGDEELIGIIQCVINFFSCLEGLVDNVDISQIQGLISQLFDKFLVQKVIDIANDFRHHEGIADYKGIKQYFKTLPYAIEGFIRENPECNFNLYTTNYDGILETVFAKDRPQGGSGFISEDGFIRKISEKFSLFSS